MQSSVPSYVPNSVPSSVNTVPVLDEPQLQDRQYYKYGGGTERIPVVPRTDTGEAPGNPPIGNGARIGTTPASGSAGAPSVPVDGFLYKQGPADPHYTNQYNPEYATSPRTKVNNPKTRGMFTWVKDYLNHIAQTPQDVDPNGFRISPPQQRTSVMRITPPARGIGYAPEFFTPRQMPQQPNLRKELPATGTSPYGTGVLNSDTFGAGQTAGGIGGSNYTPQPGPPPTYSVAGNSGNPSGMPTWG
jgi:hypothetical protein